MSETRVVSPATAQILKTLLSAARQFRTYQLAHIVAGKPEKAATNEQYAIACEQALEAYNKEYNNANS